MRLLLPLLCVFLLGGCLSQTMSAWEGKHRDNLIQEWGQPRQETELSDGGTSLVYIRTWADQHGVSTCRMVFNTDDAGIIRSWSDEGC
jgi:hypothetical protein